MVLERTIATKNYKKYENRHKTLGYCFIFGQIFMGTTTTIAIFYKFDFNQGQEFCSVSLSFLLPPCSSSNFQIFQGSQSSDPAYMIIPESVAILSNFIAFFQFGKLMRINTVTEPSKKFQHQHEIFPENPSRKLWKQLEPKVSNWGKFECCENTPCVHEMRFRIYFNLFYHGNPVPFGWQTFGSCRLLCTFRG